MLTRNEVFEMVVEVLQVHGPEELRGQTKDEIMADFQENIKSDPDSEPMVQMLMALFERAYEAGRMSVQS